MTNWEFGVSDIIPLSGWKEIKILSKASALEINSEHVIAKGIVSKAKEEKINIPKAD